MSTWGHDELMSKAVYMAAHPECGPAEVGEIFPESFRQLQVCRSWVLVWGSESFSESFRQLQVCRSWVLGFESLPECFRQICVFFVEEGLGGRTA
jgi:hypothetical protein